MMKNNSITIKWTELPNAVLEEFSGLYLSEYFSDKIISDSVADYAILYFKDILGFNVIIGRDNHDIAIVEFESEKDYMFFKLKYG